MKILLPVAILLVAVAGAAAAWFAPARQSIEGRPAARLDEAGQPATAKALTSLSEGDRAEATKLIKRVDDLGARLDKHQEATSLAWNELLSDLNRQSALSTVEGQRLASVVDAAGGKPIEAQVEDMMDETARKRVNGFLRGSMEMEIGVLKSKLGLVGTQATAVDQIVADILKEESDKVAQSDPGDNMVGWRGDIMQSARQKLVERLDPVLTGDQKLKAKDWFEGGDWGRTWREAQKKAQETK